METSNMFFLELWFWIYKPIKKYGRVGIEYGKRSTPDKLEVSSKFNLLYMIIRPRNHKNLLNIVDIQGYMVIRHLLSPFAAASSFFVQIGPMCGFELEIPEIRQSIYSRRGATFVTFWFSVLDSRASNVAYIFCWQ